MVRAELGFAVAWIVASGCASSSPPVPAGSASSSIRAAASAAASASAARASAPIAASASAPLIDLRPLTISFQGKVIARLHADGRTESAGSNAPGTTLVPGPTLHADGTMEMTRGGVRARLDDKGDIYVVQPPGVTPREPLFGSITGDELKYARSDKPWSVRVRGNLIEFGPDNSSVIDGEVTPSVRLIALVMAAAFAIDGAISSH